MFPVIGYGSIVSVLAPITFGMIPATMRNKVLFPSG
jgi:hypothetical protein